MKKTYIIFSLIAIAIFGCNDDFMDRYPIAEIAPENSFKTARDLELFTNSFYNDLPGYSNIIKGDNVSDNILYSGVPQEQSGRRTVPTNAGSGGWSWGALRKVNIFFENYEKCPDESARKEYSGVAHFFRALFYFEKVKRFGDVPWYDYVIGSTDEEALTQPRDSRTFVVEKIIEDLDRAIENLGDKRASDRVSVWTALALKSRVCLFEGTFRKYHTELGLPGAEELLKLSYEAAQRVIDKGPYSIYSTGSPSTDYRDLFASTDAIENEIILARKYSNKQDVVHSLNYYLTSATQDDISLTKNMVNSYLMSNGNPFTDQSDYATKMFQEETNNRDPRLSQTIRTPGYQRIGGTNTLLPDFSAAMTGYQVVKFLSDESQDGNEASYQDIPIIRYAEVLLNYAEAKAELGELTQGDIDKTISLLRKRVGMPNLNLQTALANPDPYLADQYKNVNGAQSGAILEIRRERRIELVLEGFRYNDLMRWKDGKLLEKHFEGMYFPSLGAFDLNGDGSVDVELFEAGTEPTSNASQKVEIGGVLKLTEGTSGNLIGFTDIAKDFDESRDYLYPIPSGDILLNKNLEQNPNWK